MMERKIRKTNKVLIVVLCVVALIMVSAIPVYAWYANSEKKAHVGEIEIDIPPMIYIKNDDLEEMTSFNLDGLQINTEYNFVFCVSPVKRNVVETFLLGVIYTENIGMTINIYPVSEISYSAPTNASLRYETRLISDPYDSNTEKTVYFTYSTANRDWAVRNETTYGNNGSTDPNYQKDNLNRGIHRTYYGMKFTRRSTAWEYTSLLSALSDTSHYVFYNLQITWENNQNNVDTDKEVDIVYITTKGTAAEE